MHDIAVITGDPQLVSLRMADDIFFGQPILLAEVGAQFSGLLIYGVEVCSIRQTVLTDFKGNMRVVTGAFCTASAMPAAHIPRQCLVGGDGTVRQFADKCVNADFPAVRLILVPVIIVLILSEQPIVRAHIPIIGNS